MTVKTSNFCPLCKREFNWIASHLKHKHHLMSAEEREPYLGLSKDDYVENGDTTSKSDEIMNDDDDTHIKFEEERRNLNIEFQDIEDHIVGLYLMTRPIERGTKHIREEIQTQLFPLYKIVRDSLEVTLFEKNVQQNIDSSPSTAKRMK